MEKDSINLSSITDNQIKEILSGIFHNNWDYRIDGCKWKCGSVYKWNKLLCKSWCRNTKNYSSKELNNIKNALIKKFSWKKFLIEKKILEFYIIWKINSILQKN